MPILSLADVLKSRQKVQLAEFSREDLSEEKGGGGEGSSNDNNQKNGRTSQKPFFRESRRQIATEVQKKGKFAKCFQKRLLQLSKKRRDG